MKYWQTWHVMHFLLSVVTVGFWIPIWILFTLVNSQHNRMIDHRLMMATVTKNDDYLKPRPMPKFPYAAIGRKLGVK